MKKIIATILIALMMIPSIAFAQIENYGSYYIWDREGFYSYQQDENIMSVIYTGGFDGDYETMGKAMTAIRQLRYQYPDSYLLDAGKMKGNDLSIEYQEKAMNVMGYDVFTIPTSAAAIVEKYYSKLGVVGKGSIDTARGVDKVICLYDGDEPDSLERVDLIISSGKKGPDRSGDIPILYAEKNKVCHMTMDLTTGEIQTDAIDLDDSVYVDPAITQVEEEYDEALDETIFGIYGFSGKDLIGHIRVFNPSFIAKAYLNTGRLLAKGDAPIAGAFFAQGTMKGSLKPGKVYTKDLYQLFGEKESGNLVDVYLSGAELKILAEIDASISEKNPDVKIYGAGISYVSNPHRFYRNRVSEVRLSNGEKVKDRSLYRVITDTKTIDILKQARKAPFGLMDLVFKDKDGNPLTSLGSAVIDYKGKAVKQWVAVAKGKIAKKGGCWSSQIEDKSLGAILKNPGKIFVVSLLASIILLALVILLIAAIIGLIRRKLGIRNTAFIRNARKANKQPKMFSNRRKVYNRKNKYRGDDRFIRSFRKK
ncbi:MAG: 5'-nucleotidase C-terminal domain-containing protein [Clostridia bacterium]|nr:5'-nucleotidase C-terminal domain-containing protein [Clostridia bacterium]